MGRLLVLGGGPGIGGPVKQRVHTVCTVWKKNPQWVVFQVDLASHCLYGYAINSNKAQQKGNKRQVLFRYLTRSAY